MTFSELCEIVNKSFNPTNNVLKLERTWNAKDWLTGDKDFEVINTHWKDITEAQQFLIEQCHYYNDGSECPSGVCLRQQEYSSGPYSPKMFPLKNLPRGRPYYTAARPIFSHWEKDQNNRATNQRSSHEKAMKDFERSRNLICNPEGPLSRLRYGAIDCRYFVYDCMEFIHYYLLIIRMYLID